MRLTLRTLAALLSYPSEELRGHVPDLRTALAQEAALPRRVRDGLQPLLDRLERDEVLDSQAGFTDLFDRSRALSLHLFEHVHGDKRERGQAMLDLAEQYMQQGLLLDTDELPDHVAVFLEFASCLPQREAMETLAQPAHVFAALQQRLAERESDYAAVFAAILALAAASPDHESVEALQRNAPSDDPARIDEEWEEKAVTFTEAHEMGGPTGFVARMRAKGRAMTAARRNQT